jgi:ribosomal protein S12 methylthiotransferase accessory factor YcaO
MKIEITFHGPHSDDMVRHGVLDLEKNGHDHIYYGKGLSRAAAATAAVGALAESAQAHLLPSVLAESTRVLLPHDYNMESDGVLCNMFCIIRVTE